ncbi:MAG: hypothetical protein M3X11_05100, partial [Acidobacteriota bacterium]|nr:hypothetical protein [Acidobacteriota bacterium]
MFTKHRTNRISQTLNLLAIILSLLAIPSLPLRAQQPSQPPAAPRPELALQIGHRGFIYAVAIAPDNKTAASISYDGTLKLWDAQTGDLLRTIVIPKGESDDSPSEMRFSPDGKTITLPEATLDLQSGELKANAPALRCPDEAKLVAAAPDGKTAVCERTISAGEIGHRVEFFWWHPQTTQRALITKNGQWFDMLAFEFSPDGRTIAIYSHGGHSEAIFWDVTTRQVKRHLHDLIFRSFSPDSQTIVLQAPEANRCDCPKDDQRRLSDKAKLGAVELWDMQLRAAKRTLIGREFFGYAPDGQTILLINKAAQATAATLELWDAQLRTLKQKLSVNLQSRPQPLYSPDGRIMALPNASNLASEADRAEIILYDLPAGKLIGRLPTGFIASDRIAFSQDGAMLTTLSWSSEAKLWDAHTGALKAEIKLPAQQPAEIANQSSGADLSVQDIAFSTDGQTIVGGAQSGAIRLWNFRTGRVIKTVVLPADSSPHFFVVGQTIIQAEPNLPPLTWDVRTLQPQPPPATAAEKPRAESIATLALNGRLSVKLSDDRKSATLYDAQTGRQLHALNGHAGAISVVLFAPDNRTLATVSGFPSFDSLSEAALVLAAVMDAG